MRNLTRKVTKYGILGLLAFFAIGLVLHLIFGVIATLFGLLLPLILFACAGVLLYKFVL